MTLQDLIDALDSSPPDSPLFFVTPDGPVRGGYHLTEVKRADITGLACNGSQSTWREVSLQLLDGFGGTHMTVAKFLKIAGLAVDGMPDTAALPLYIEYGAGNATRALYTLETPVFADTAVTVALKPTHVGCKALTAAQEKQVMAGSRCC